MKCEVKCAKPDEIEFTISMTATSKEWINLRDEIYKLDDIYPFASLTKTISGLLMKVNKTFRGEE